MYTELKTDRLLLRPVCAADADSRLSVFICIPGQPTGIPFFFIFACSTANSS